jgi:hypothetical protein
VVEAEIQAMAGQEIHHRFPQAKEITVAMGRPILLQVAEAVLA